MKIKWSYVLTSALGCLLIYNLLSLSETVFLLIGFALVREVMNPYKGLNRRFGDLLYDLLGIGLAVSCIGLFK